MSNSLANKPFIISEWNEVLTESLNLNEAPTESLTANYEDDDDLKSK